MRHPSSFLELPPEYLSIRVHYTDLHLSSGSLEVNQMAFEQLCRPEGKLGSLGFGGGRGGGGERWQWQAAVVVATGSFCNLLSWHIYEWALHGRNFLAMAIKVTQYQAVARQDGQMCVIKTMNEGCIIFAALLLNSIHATTGCRCAPPPRCRQCKATARQNRFK